MIQPKELYRQLAALLANMDKGRDDAHYLLIVLEKLDSSFARDLHITHGHLYAEDNEQFLPVNALQDGESARSVDTRALDAEAAGLVVKNGLYICEDPSIAIRLKQGQCAENTTPAAFLVSNRRRQWIFVFELESGWVREEVEFCFNAIRA